MPIQLSQYPFIKKVFGLGAAWNVVAKFLGLPTSQYFIDAQNMRSNGLEGDSAALSKIKGEDLLYPSEDNSCNSYYGSNFNNGKWICLDALYITYKKVEMWADENGILAPFIRIDGVIVAASPDLPINVNYPIQTDKNDTCGGGLFCITDFHTPPVLLSVKDILDNATSCTEQYFSNFKVDKYQPNFKIPAHHLTFIELSPGSSYPADLIVGSTGMTDGMVAYSHRYFDAFGNRTGWGAPSVLIPIPISLDYRDDIYPAIKTYGADPNKTTGYGVVLKLRIQNDLGYTGIEIKRWSYTTGAPVGFTPVATLIGTLKISDQEWGTRTILDFGEPGTPLTDEEDTSQSGAIKAAKSTRFFDTKLGFFNIEYESQDASGLVFSQRNGKTVFPVLDKMGKIGHSDPWNGAYRRSYRSGEAYGLAVGCWGTNMNRMLLVKEPTTCTSPGLPMADRRDDASPETQLFSYNGLPTAVTYTANDPQLCHEVYDMVNATSKATGCDVVNISCDGTKGGAGGCAGDCGINDIACTELDSPYHATDAGYKPLHPTGQGDGNVSGHNYRLNNHVETTCDDYFAVLPPKTFAPNYYSKGWAINGLSNFPVGTQAVSIVRTKPSGRVVAQGIGFYYLASGKSLGGNRTAKKDKKSFYFYSSELTPRFGILTPAKIAEINANVGGRYKAQLISPTGMTSEMPWGWFRNTKADVCDLAVYARFYKDNTEINEGMAVSTSNGGYIEYGKWRNSNAPSWVADINNNASSHYKAMFTIDGLRDANNSGVQGTPSSPPGNPGEFIGDRGSNYMVLHLTEDVYDVDGVGLNSCDSSYDSTDVKNFDEPMYYINIIDTLAVENVTSGSQFFDTGTFYKLDSSILKSDGTGGGTGSLDLIDERWEDVRPYTANIYNNVATVDFNNLNSIVWVELTDGTLQGWLNADGVSPTDIATMEASLPFTIGSGAISKPGVTISGFYTTSATQVNGIDRFYSIAFPFTVKPALNSIVHVKYDSEIPLAIYGGDTWIGNDIFCPVDRKIKNNHSDPSDEADADQPFFMDFGFPYYKMEINPRILINNNADGNSNVIQDCCRIRVQHVRQMICMFNCESPVHLPYFYEGDKLDTYQMAKFFPSTNYIERPTKWDNTSSKNKCSQKGKIYDQYWTDYPDEDQLWGYGGYRFLPLNNIDYMHSLNTVPWALPPVNWKEQTVFCTRFIWSLSHYPGSQDVPGLRTFLPGNYYDIDDRMGEGKKIWTTNGGNTGFNVYAFTDRGINVILTGQDILRDATGDQIAVLKSLQGNYVRSDQWIHTDIGLNAEMWRTFTENNGVCYFTNLTSSFRFDGSGKAQDILRDSKYYGRLQSILYALNGSYSDKMTAYYDTRYKEYIVQLPYVINSGGESILKNACFRFKDVQNEWDGYATFAFDKYLSIDEKTWAMGRIMDSGKARTFTLGEANYLIDDEPIESFVLVPFTPGEIEENKEMVGFRAIASTSPDRIDVYDNLDQYLAGTPATTIPSTDFDDFYNDFEAYMNCRISTNERMQGQSVILVPVHAQNEAFTLSAISLFYRKLFKN